MRLAVLLLLALAACQPKPATVTTRPTYRDPRALIASKADFDPARLAGDWHEVARFPGTTGCAAGRIAYVSTPPILQQTTRCRSGDTSVEELLMAPLGRLSVTSGTEPQPIWVLWTDTGYRTAVLVSPDGTGGRVLDRTPALPVDRLRAVMEVLDFNGFDTQALVFP